MAHKQQGIAGRSLLQMFVARRSMLTKATSHRTAGRFRKIRIETENSKEDPDQTNHCKRKRLR
jgi:hypothetical protein